MNRNSLTSFAHVLGNDIVFFTEYDEEDYVGFLEHGITDLDFIHTCLDHGIEPEIAITSKDIDVLVQKQKQRDKELGRS